MLRILYEDLRKLIHIVEDTKYLFCSIRKTYELQHTLINTEHLLFYEHILRML